MIKREAFNWAVAITGVLASVITIILGLGAIFGWFQQTPPPVVYIPARHVVQPPPPKPKESNKFGLGSVSKGIGRALTVPKH